MKKKLLTTLLIINLFWLGCGGREAHPMAAYQPGDQKRSCEGLRLEIAQLDADIAAKIPKANKTGKNVVLGILGFFLIIPWFFMDPKNADKTELEAMQVRRSRLVLIAGEKDCDLLVGDAQHSAYRSQPKEEPAREEPAERIEPRAFATPEPSAHTGRRPLIVVEGIVYSPDRPAALIGDQIVREGGSVSGARVTKITRDSVEFSFNGTTWRQGVTK